MSKRGIQSERSVSVSDLLEQMATEIEVSLPDQQVADAGLTPLWTPNPGPQTDAVASEADELFYGGAAGGGKTDLLLGLAVSRHRSSIIFRRESTQFQGAEGMIERSREIIGLRGKFNGQMKFWREIDGARALEFGSVPAEKDKNKWRGRPHDLKGFDELPQFSESQYRFLIGWLRTSVPGQRVRVVATGNPPDNADGEWVNRYWGPWLNPMHPNPAQPGELRYFAVINGEDVERPNGDPFEHNGELIKPRSRTFIPARVEDNPYYMKTGYIDVLNNLPEPLRSQLRHGSFKARGKDDPWQVIPTAWIEAAQDRWADRYGKDPGFCTAAGADPSRGGTDQFVIAKRHGDWLAPLVKHSAKEAPDGDKGAMLIFNALDGQLLIPVMIDVIGTAGGSVFDTCVRLHMTAISMNGSMASYKRDKSGKLGFVNKRAEWYWNVREILDPTTHPTICLPPDPQMKVDLCAPRWRPTPKGILVESKDDIRKRLGRSPDSGDAVVYALSNECSIAPLEIVSGTGKPESEMTPEELQAKAEAERTRAAEAVMDQIRRTGVYWPSGGIR